jgi:hypothetical protein
MRLIEHRLHQINAPDNFVRGFFYASGTVNFWHNWHTDECQKLLLARRRSAPDSFKTLDF